MRKGKAHVYAGVLNIPARRVGNFGIEHDVRPAGTCMPLANPRTMLYGNPERGSVEFPQETRWHVLKEYDSAVLANGEHDGRWMTDWPIEQAQHDRELADFTRGTVLVGGLGLGYAATVLCRRANIKRVVVVERSPEVVALVEEPTRRNLGRRAAAKLEVVTADLFDYLRSEVPAPRFPKRAAPFTRAFYDIWASDGVATLLETVAPLLQLSRGVVASRPVCWNEGIMRGQVSWELTSRSHMLGRVPREDSNTPEEAMRAELAYLTREQGNVYHDTFVLFWLWAKEVVEATPDEGQRVLKLTKGAQRFAEVVGNVGWVERWKAYQQALTAVER